MTQHKVIRIFSFLTIVAQVAIGIWTLDRYKNVGPDNKAFIFLIPLQNGAIMDLLFCMPVFIVTIVFMIWDKTNRLKYAADMIIQLFSLVGIPVIFSSIIDQ